MSQRDRGECCLEQLSYKIMYALLKMEGIMRSARTLMVFLLLGLLIVSCAAKNAGKGGDANSIAGILATAGSPLSADQVKQLKDFKPGGDRGAFRAIYDVFNDKQLNALKASYGSSPGRDGGPERPRFLFFAVIFENAGCPLTGEQLQAMKALPNERGAFRQVRDLLNDKQGDVLEGMFNR